MLTSGSRGPVRESSLPPCWACHRCPPATLGFMCASWCCGQTGMAYLTLAFAGVCCILAWPGAFSDVSSRSWVSAYYLVDMA